MLSLKENIGCVEELDVGGVLDTVKERSLDCDTEAGGPSTTRVAIWRNSLGL